MKIDIVMPKMGESITEGTIIKWHKQIGEPVKRDEVIFEISTDKVDTEVTSAEDGQLEKILVQEQETVEVGTVVAILNTMKSEDTELLQPIVSADAVSLTENNAIKIEEAPQHKAKSYDGKRFYSPLVMSIASKENISHSELDSIRGTGDNDRVTKKDILSYLETKGKILQNEISKSVNENSSVSQVVRSSNVLSNEIIPMDAIRQKIMQNMMLSSQTSVHVSSIIEVDMTRVQTFIRQNRDRLHAEIGVKITPLTCVANAVVKALREFPLMNSSIKDKTIIQKKNINLGIAIALDNNGLIVPNIKNSDEKSLVGLASSITELADKARKKKLSIDDVSDGTFTISNYGVFGTVLGTPIINQPEVAILGIGSITKKPVVIEVEEEDHIAIREMMYLSLSHDHRIIDGMLGAKFLGAIKHNLENFSEKYF